jgi:hypothetical protein
MDYSDETDADKNQRVEKELQTLLKKYNVDPSRTLVSDLLDWKNKA